MDLLCSHDGLLNKFVSWLHKGWSGYNSPTHGEQLPTAGYAS